MTKITVATFIDTRDTSSYGRKIRVLNDRTHENMGEWYKNTTAIVKSIKVTKKALFIFI